MSCGRAVRERSGCAEHRGAALTHLGRLLILLRLPLARSVWQCHTPPWHTWALAGRWPFEGWDNWVWDISVPCIGGAGASLGLWPSSHHPPSLFCTEVCPRRGSASPPVQGQARAMGGGGDTSVGTRLSCLVVADVPMAFWGAACLPAPLWLLKAGGWLSRDKGCDVPVPWPALFSATTHQSRCHWGARTISQRELQLPGNPTPQRALNLSSSCFLFEKAREKRVSFTSLG